MAKTKEELNQIKKEYESLSKKLSALTSDELKEVTGGIWDISVKKKERFKCTCDDWDDQDIEAKFVD